MESEPSEYNEQDMDRDLEMLLKCPIFQSNLDGTSITDCGHRVCNHCIFLWLEKYSTCPICSAPITIQEVSNQSRVELLDNVMLMNDRAIDRQAAIISSRDATIQQHCDKADETACELADLTLQLENMQVAIDIQRGQHEQIVDILHDIHENVIPERDQIIERLRNHITDLSDKADETACELADLKKQLENMQEVIDIQRDQNENIAEELSALYERTIPISELVAVRETKLHNSLEQLQRYYDREYRSKIEITDAMEVLLRTRLEKVLIEVCNDPERGDQLALVIKTYTSLVDENCSLHRTQRTLATEIKHLKTVIKCTKARTYELEMKCQMDYMMEE